MPRKDHGGGARHPANTRWSVWRLGGREDRRRNRLLIGLLLRGEGNERCPLAGTVAVTRALTNDEGSLFQSYVSNTPGVDLRPHHHHAGTEITVSPSQM